MEKFSKIQKEDLLKKKDDKESTEYEDTHVKIVKFEDWTFVDGKDVVICIFGMFIDIISPNISVLTPLVILHNIPTLTAFKTVLLTVNKVAPGATEETKVPKMVFGDP